MNDRWFDALGHFLPTGVSRRGALGLLAGFAGLGLGKVTANRRKRRRGGNRTARGRSRVQAAKADKPGKVAICHHDAGTGRVHRITVAASAVRAHQDNHGDFLFGACCTGAECRPGQTCQPGSGDATSTCVDPCVTDLLAALAAAEDGDIIRLCPGVYEAADVEIAADVTLIGAGSGDQPATNTILDAGGAGRVLIVPSGVTATLQAMRLVNGSSPIAAPMGNGGAILNEGTLTLDGVVVADSTTHDGGGGIASGGMLSLLNNSEVSDNEAELFGGGIFLTTGAALIVDGSTVRNNRALFNGGGIAGQFGTTITLKSGSLVRDNVARLVGGGINTVGNLTLEAASTVARNTAGSQGGGINMVNPGAATVQAGAVICGNSPDDCAGSGTIDGTCPQLPPDGICPA